MLDLGSLADTHVFETLLEFGVRSPEFSFHGGHYISLVRPDKSTKSGTGSASFPCHSAAPSRSGAWRLGCLELSKGLIRGGFRK